MASSTMASRAAASTHGIVFKSNLATSTPRCGVLCRAGYEAAPSRRPLQNFDDEYEEDLNPPSRPAARPGPGSQGGYQQRQGNYVQRGEGNPNSFNNTGGGQKQYGSRPYQPRRQYNNAPGGEEGQQADGQQYRPRRQFNNNNNNPGEGQGGQDGAPRQRRQFNNNGGERRGGQEGGEGRREFISPEEQARRTEVNGAIRSARDWQAISGVLAQFNDRLDGENVSTMFGKMAREKRPADEESAAAFDQVLSSLLGWVLALAPTPNFRPRHTALTLQALGRMQLYSPEVVELLVSRATQQMNSFGEQDLVYLVQGISSLNHVPSADFVDQFFAQSGRRLSDMKVLDLSKLLQGLVKLGLHVSAPTTWLETAMEAVRSRCMLLPASDVENKAITEQENERGRRNRGGGRQSGGTHPGSMRMQEYIEMVMAVTTISRDTGAQVPLEVVEALLTRQSWRVPFMTVESCTSMLWAASTLPTKPSPAWVAAVDLNIASKNWYWTPEDLTQQCMYLGRYLQFRASPNLCNRLKQFWTDRRQDLGLEGLATILYLYAVSSYVPDERWLDGVLIYIKEQLPVASLTSLELIFNALPQLNNGYRLNEVVALTGERYNELVAQQAAYASDQGVAAEDPAAAMA